MLTFVCLSFLSLKALSGGQKRKLHVGIAFSGNSTVIFLDGNIYIHYVIIN